jgi:hypothetical protein
MLKKEITFVISAVALWLIGGCSNQSPVSVVETNNTPEKVALISDRQMQDISGCSGEIWGIDMVDAANASDYYLYYFKPSTASWVKTDHWGKKVAVVKYGKCYHFNSENTIWCCKMLNQTTDSSGFVASAPSGKTIVDIGAGYLSNSIDAVWIICSDKTCYKGYVSSGVFQGWTWVSDFSGYTQVYAITADPWHGENVCVGTNNGIARLVGGTFSAIPNLTGNISDVGVYNTTFYYYQSWGCLYHIELNGTPSSVQCNSYGLGVSVDPTKYFYLQYYGNPYYQNY